MELSLVLGGLGILVSIAVGFGTYYLAERRGRRNRWQASKDTVLRDLSKSLGEGSVPQPAVILATIRSVLRSQNAPDLAVVTLEEVKDDLLRQITADPFLEAERRTQLQTQVLELKAPETPSGPPGPRAAAEAWLERETLWTQFSFAALLAGVLASLVAGQLWDLVSHEAVFLFGAIFAGLAGVVLMLIPLSSKQKRLRHS